MPRTVAQPFAMVMAFVCVNAEQIICRTLHTVSHRKNLADIGIAGLPGRQWHAQTNQARLIDQRDMQSVSFALFASIAAPQCHQPPAAVTHVLANRLQIVGLDLAQPRGARAGKLGQVQIGMGDGHRFIRLIKPPLGDTSQPNRAAYTARGSTPATSARTPGSVPAGAADGVPWFRRTRSAAPCRTQRRTRCPARSAESVSSTDSRAWPW